MFLLRCICKIYQIFFVKNYDMDYKDLIFSLGEKKKLNQVKKF